MKIDPKLHTASIDQPFAPSWVMANWKSIASVLTFIAIFSMALYEVAYFWGLGLSSPAAFPRRIPIPASEMAQIFLWGCVGFFVAASLLTSFLCLIYMLAMGIVHFVSALRLSSRASSIAANDHVKRWGGQAFLFLTGVPFQLVGKSHIGFREMAVRIFIALLAIYLVVAVLHPIASYILDFTYETRDGPVAALRVFLYAFEFYLVLALLSVVGLNYDYRLVVRFPDSKWLVGIVLSSLTVTSIGAIGYRAGLDIHIPKEHQQIAAVPIEIVAPQCSLLNAPKLVRSYTNGTLLLEGKKLVWLPSDKGSCWAIPLQQEQIEERLYPPVVLGTTLDSWAVKVFGRHMPPPQ